MKREETIEKIAELESILSEFKDLVSATAEALEGTGEDFRAGRTWLGNIRRALDNNHEFGPSINMKSTIDDLRESVKPESDADNTAGNYYMSDF